MHNIIKQKLEQAKKNKDLELMEILYKNNSNNLQITFEYARLLIATGKKIEGKLMLEDLLNSRIENCALLELASIEREEGNIEQSKEYLKKLLYFQSDRRIALYELAKLEKEKGKVTEARNYLKQLMLEPKQKYCAILELGKLEKEVGNIEAARHYFESLLDTSSAAYATLELGILEKEENHPELAKVYFEKLLRIDKEEDFVLNLLALLAIDEGDYVLAFKYVKESLNRGFTVPSNLLLYISKKLNIFFDINYETIKYNYSLRQLIDYDIEDAMEHIIERHTKQAPDASLYREDVDIYKLFNNIRSMIEKKKKEEKMHLNNSYLFNRKNIGAKGENYLFVVTLPDSNDIITMYPVRSRRQIYRYIEEDGFNTEKVLIKK